MPDAAVHLAQYQGRWPEQGTSTQPSRFAPVASDKSGGTFNRGIGGNQTVDTGLKGNFSDIVLVFGCQVGGDLEQQRRPFPFGCLGQRPLYAKQELAHLATAL